MLLSVVLTMFFLFFSLLFEDYFVVVDLALVPFILWFGVFATLCYFQLVEGKNGKGL